MAVAYSRVMFLGTAGVGKTCFNRSLRKLPWRQDCTSTLISDVMYIKPSKPRSMSYQVYTHKDEQWPEVTPEEEIEEIAQLMVGVVRKSPEKFTSEDTSSTSFYLKGSNMEQEKFQKITNIISKVTRAAQSQSTNLDSQPFFNFWDCGGQPVFLEILPAFLSPRTLFFLVFDASKSLNINWQSNYHIEGKRFDGEEVNMTTLDFMLSWMANIHGHLMAYNKDGGVADYPRIFCIGTHGDHLTEEEKSKVKRELEGHYHEKGYNNLIEGTLIVDNTSSNTKNEDPSIHRVREEVIKFTKENLKKMTPLTWVLFHKVLKELCENVIHLHTAYEIGAATNISQNEVPSVLLFYHDLGTILFYPQIPGLKDIVIINPKYFVDTLGKIFSFDLLNGMPRFSEEVSLFHEYGILVEPLYVEVWKSCENLKPNMFIETMIHFCLAAQVTTSLYPRSQYFLPSILPLCPDDIKAIPQYFLPSILPLCPDDIKAIPNDSFRAAPLHITFSTGFVPPGFFTRFIAVLARNFELFWKNKIYRNHVTFRYNELKSSSIEHIIVNDHHDVIQVDVYRATSGFSLLPPQKVYPKLLTTLKESAREVEKVLSYNIRENQRVACATWSINYVCTNCSQLTSLHYLILFPSHQTSEFEVCCDFRRRYRKLKENEKVWFKSAYHYESDSDALSTSSLHSKYLHHESTFDNCKKMAIDQFIEVSDQLSNAMAPCIDGVITKLYAKRVIGSELKEDLILRTPATNLEKARKLVIELDRLLRTNNDCDEVLKEICSVLEQQDDPTLTKIVHSMKF